MIFYGLRCCCAGYACCCARRRFHFAGRATLLRFLRARDSKIKKATRMFIDMLEWFRDIDLPKKLAAWDAETSPEKDLIARRYPCGIHGVDLRGVPAYYGRYGVADLAGIVREAEYDNYFLQVPKMTSTSFYLDPSFHRPLRASSTAVTSLQWPAPP